MTTARTVIIVAGGWILVILGAVYAFGQEAQPQQVACAPNYGVMKAKLEENFGELPRDMGLSGQSGMTLFVSPGGATFTLTATRVDGRTCIVVAGKDWAELAAPLTGDPA